MISDRLEVWQPGVETRLVEKLPDGSTAVFDTLTKTVHSINEIAAAAFEACRDKRTVTQVAAAMQETLNSPVSEEIALTAIYELERAGLVACSRPVSASRRSLLKSVGTIAATVAPLVLSLSSAEQSAFAQGAGSGTTTTSTTTTTTTTTTTAGPVASISSIAPSTVAGCDNTTNGVVITGVNTHFGNSSIVTFSNSHLSASNVVVNSLTSLTLTINENTDNPTPALVTVTVTTGSEVAVGTNILTFGSCT